MAERRLIGIDAGSASASVVAMDESGRILASAYDFHKGRIAECLETLLADLLPEGRAAAIKGLARSSSAPPLAGPEGKALAIDGRVAEIEALRKFHPETRTFLVVGAERFSRIAFDAKGRYSRLRGNSSCAAGTGSFLDQQATRLGLAGGSSELAALALENRGEQPSIASRCSVFAKTDLINAQAEGWSVNAICEGLCHGLARNIADTLFPGESPEAPIFMAGGVSRNAAVVRYLSDIAASPISTDEFSHLYGAIGACLRFIAADSWTQTAFAVGEIQVAQAPERDYAAAALEAPADGYPDFASLSRFLHVARKGGPSNPVEVDIYLDPATVAAGASVLPALLGIDIGSTSTKAAILTEDGRVVAGFYTRTAGRPLEATQSIFEAIERVGEEAGLSFEALLAATTGSGRRLVAAVIGADQAMDEITAHARAAVELDPEVDTIIEIGGQDSKFTLLEGGIVTFSQMNAVCAAGTGSFLEEQAGRLGVPLLDFSARALGSRAPLTSDRCTVFMERDLNHLRGQGYTIGELLAASLFSVCDNYLSKVAREGSIGRSVTFQGATAKNRALVAAFERRLGRKIRVSKYCHLTGAIGAALQSRDELQASRAGDGRGALAPSAAFRGFGLHRLDLASRSERCGLCPNDCRLRVVEVGEEEVAFGFLCGRDYDTKRFVQTEKGRNLLGERSLAIREVWRKARQGSFPRLGHPTIGIPTSLYLGEDAPFWRCFFELLGFPTLLAPDDGPTLREGKRLAGAEFCVPMAMFHGQARALLEAADFAFLPIYLEEEPDHPPLADSREGARRYYCNYSQYAPIVTRCAESKDRGRILSPLLRGRHGDTTRAVEEIRKSLRIALAPWGIRAPSERSCRLAWDACVAARLESRIAVKKVFAERSAGNDIGIVLVGRPYAVLSAAMGGSIGEMIAKRGVELAYADMLPRGNDSAIDPLLAAFHWRYASEVLEAAEYCSHDRRFYPIFITTFKCSPDSFALEWFRRILDRAGKPYLVLQIDEHDSGVGYETRIEAALRSFRNHFRRAERERAAAEAASLAGVADAGGSLAGKAAHGDREGLVPTLEKDLRGKILLFPDWDPLVCPLLAANLRSVGVDARLIGESPASIRRAMSGNSGQCIPISIIAGECMEEVERGGLDPAKVVLWIGAGMWPCNLPMYPHFIKTLFEGRGGGMENIGVFSGDITFLYLGPKAMVGAYHAFLAGGTLRRLACRTRPYEIEAGATALLVDRAMAILLEAFATGRPKDAAYREAFAPFGELPTKPRTRPKVAIFGDLYSRDNDVLNQGLEKAIEAAGGEVITTPYIDYIKASLDAYFRRLLIDRSWGEWAKMKAAVAVLAAIEKSLSLADHATFGSLPRWSNPGYLEKIERLGLRGEFEGECFDNAIKVFRILDEHPDTAFFVQANPAFCCPSIVTEAMAREIEIATGVPIVTITYDGTGAPKNDAIIPYLAFGRDGEARRGPASCVASS
ncbi:MAG TPA: BadF/BadG/BcrA/BcrD ATPase family protein [Rectinemataceae bacterium]|nr:BadF/BadG/BcrA/BcrD ATPase family protein [Rectinemataceae bacterium]